MVRTENEKCHYEEAERWLAKAEQRYDGCTLDMTWEAQDEAFIDRCLRFAAVHAQLSVAADQDRIADCVPAGASRFQVAGTR